MAELVLPARSRLRQLLPIADTHGWLYANVLARHFPHFIVAMISKSKPFKDHYGAGFRRYESPKLGDMRLS